MRGGNTALVRGRAVTAPFPSFWYCHSGNAAAAGNSDSNGNALGVTPSLLTQTFGVSGAFKKYGHQGGLRYASSPADLPRDVRGNLTQAGSDQI